MIGVWSLSFIYDMSHVLCAMIESIKVWERECLMYYVLWHTTAIYRNANALWRGVRQFLTKIIHFVFLPSTRKVLLFFFICIRVLYIADKENVPATDPFLNYPSDFAYISRQNYVYNHDQIRVQLTFCLGRKLNYDEWNKDRLKLLILT